MLDKALMAEAKLVTKKQTNAPITEWRDKRSGSNFRKGRSFFIDKRPNTGSSSSSSQSSGSMHGYPECRRKHKGTCHHASSAYFRCGKTGHMIRDCLMRLDTTTRPVASSAGSAPAPRTNVRANTGRETLRQGRVFALVPRDVQNTDYEILHTTIGRGSSSCVFKAHNRDTNETVALKRIYLLEKNECVPSSAIREVSFLKEMDHSNVVRLLDVVDNDKALHLVLEYMDLDLKKSMASSPDIAKNQQSLMHQLLDGLAYCHSQKIHHRDLKPQNLLIDCKSILKLADFGSARETDVPLHRYTEGEMREIGRLWYMAPELLLGSRKCSTPVDIWSAGCVCAEMVIQRPLFTGYTQVIKIFSIMGKPNEETWPGVTLICDFLDAFVRNEPQNLAELVLGLEPAGVDLLSKMLCMNPEGRITTFEALEHPYFDDILESP
ncbi:cell division control protein 2 homolog [Camellia sinensis]|uniref:cell division control protein 2 homolog n=1 Tax=Camellia sinensis TaxID=4442 RepID=UPI0010366FFD|nr:cell division control protein 2 homolog [Camellia sinensis]